MRQLEIEYFFPLTEQIPLDLDYTDCENPKVWWSTELLGTGNNNGFTFTTGANTWGTVSISGSQLNLDVKEIEFKLDEKPSLLRRSMYKLMGLKWKVK